jgi:hypothetical protein
VELRIRDLDVVVLEVPRFQVFFILWLRILEEVVLSVIRHVALELFDSLIQGPSSSGYLRVVHLLIVSVRQLYILIFDERATDIDACEGCCIYAYLGTLLGHLDHGVHAEIDVPNLRLLELKMIALLHFELPSYRSQLVCDHSKHRTRLTNVAVV